MGTMPKYSKTALFDNFRGSSINRNEWAIVYGGRSSNGAFSYSSSDISTGAGDLTITTRKIGGGWTTGGFSQGPLGGKYGLFQVDAKADPGKGVGPNVLLWPDNNSWPPEVDLLEAPNGKGDAFMTLHWAGPGGSNQFTTIDTHVNVNAYHDYAVDWEPQQLTFYVDGRSVWTTTQHIPTIPMGLGIAGFVAANNDPWFGGGPNGTTPSTVAMHVAWASITKPAGVATAAVTNGLTAGSAATAITTASIGDVNATNSQTLLTQTGTDVLVGGHGNDTMWIRAASPDGWAEIDNWHAGDVANFLGVSGNATVTWANQTDPNGHWGATAAISVNGDGHVDSTVTFAGVDVSQLQHSTTAGFSNQGTPFLSLHG
jgi:beta-glucanase (GH16 family)